MQRILWLTTWLDILESWCRSPIGYQEFLQTHGTLMQESGFHLTESFPSLLCSLPWPQEGIVSFQWDGDTVTADTSDLWNWIEQEWQEYRCYQWDTYA